mgnify:CR=1 FL=1
MDRDRELPTGRQWVPRTDRLPLTRERILETLRLLVDIAKKRPTESLGMTRRRVVGEQEG